jgi:hypothetical protein
MRTMGIAFLAITMLLCGTMKAQNAARAERTASTDGDLETITIQDDESGDHLVIDQKTGEFKFSRCSDGLVLSGTGTLKLGGCNMEFQARQDDVKVLASVDECTQEAKATVQIAHPPSITPNPQPSKMLLRDSDMRNSQPTCNRIGR